MNYVNSGVLFLADATPILIGSIIGVVCLLVAVFGAIFWVSGYKKNTEKQVGSAKEQSEKLISEAQKEAKKIVSQGEEESKRAYKEAVLRAKEQELELRNNLDRET